MSIHHRVAQIHMNLMNRKIEKTGWNGHKKFKYYELEDIMAPILDECFKQEITVEFTYSEGVAILKLVDWNNPKDYIPFRVAMPEVIPPEKNPNNAVIQTIGANMSYLQRYLLKLAFPCLNDKDIIDSGISDEVKDDASSATNRNNNSSKKDEVADLPMRQLLLEAREELNKKGVEDKDITLKALKKQIFKKNWTPAERRAIINYFKEKEGSE